MTDNKGVKLTQGLAKKVDRFFNTNRPDPARLPLRFDHPAPRRADTGLGIGAGEVGSAQMIGIGTIVQVYNPGPTVRGEVPIYWSAGTEVSEANGDDPPKRGQWEVFNTAGGDSEGQNPSAPTGNADVNCDCNTLVVGQSLPGFEVCGDCGNLYRFTVFGTLQLPNPTPEEPPLTWADSGGLKKWTWQGGNVYATTAFAHPREACAGDLYRYKLTLFPATEDAPVTGTIELERVTGDSCDLVQVSWCLDTKAGCGFECNGVWQFKRSRPWANVQPSSISCSLCVTPQYPKLQPDSLTNASCGCGAIIKLPLKFHGPSGADLADHGFGDVTYTHWTGWENLWELTAAVNLERFGDGVLPPGGGSPDQCFSKHLQARGTGDVPPGGLGNSYTAIWNTSALIQEVDDVVTITVVFDHHLESYPLDNGNSDYEAAWTRVFSIELTCEEYAESIANRYIDLPETEQSDLEGTYPGGDDTIRVWLDGSYPDQEEPTSSDECGPPDDTPCSKPCRLIVRESIIGGVNVQYFSIINTDGCGSADCHCEGLHQLNSCLVTYIEGIGEAGDFSVDDEFDVDCVVGPPPEASLLTFTFTPNCECDAAVFQLCSYNSVQWEGIVQLCEQQVWLTYYEDAGTYYLNGPAGASGSSDPEGPFFVGGIEGCEGGFTVTVSE